MEKKCTENMAGTSKYGSGTIKNLPEEERPYEKFQKYGSESLTDAELLAVILRSGTAGISALDLSKRILSEEYGGGILGIYRMSTGDLMRIRGIGEVKAIQIKCIGELSRRIARASYKKKICLDQPAVIAEFFMEELRHEDQEQVRICMLDTKCHYLGDKVISIGTVNGSMASPREIFMAALQYRASQIVLLHNHPSGDPTPSREDINMTERIFSAGEIMGISLADHIIIGDGTYFSMAEHHFGK